MCVCGFCRKLIEPRIRSNSAPVISMSKCSVYDDEDDDVVGK